MQSRVATAASRSTSLLRLFGPQKQGFFRRIASVGGGTADPSIHSGEVEAGPDVKTNEPQGLENSSHHRKLDEFETEAESSNETDPLTQPKLPHESSPRLKSSPVNNPFEPYVQQRRKISAAAALEGVSCAGLDGTPWPEVSEGNDQGGDKKEQAKDNKEYYGRHKASPLSEIEIEDTRKPITRATDGTATGQSKRDVIGWLPEQLDTAEEALMRAARIWKENASRGIPEAPHSRVLRELRGEWF